MCGESASYMESVLRPLLECASEFEILRPAESGVIRACLKPCALKSTSASTYSDKQHAISNGDAHWPATSFEFHILSWHEALRRILNSASGTPSSQLMCPFHGAILAYVPHRKASFAIIKFV